MKPLRSLIMTLAALPGMGQEPAPPPVDRGFRFSVVNDLLYQQNELATWETGPGAETRDPLRAQRQFLEALSLSANAGLGSWGELSAGLTLRSTNFYQQRSDLTLLQPDTSIYRKYLNYRVGGLSAGAGNFYAMLGRGLVLSILPIDKLMKERSIEGADLRYQGTWVEMRALSGRVQTETRDQEWRVQGGEVLVKFIQGNRIGTHRIGAHAAQIEDVPTAKTEAFQLPLMRKRGLGSLSLSGDNIGKAFSYYFECARLKWERKPEDFAVIPPGEAGYGNFALKAGKLFVMGEYRRYLRFESDLIDPQNTLNNPPLADREDEKNNLIHSEALRSLVQYRFNDPDLSFFISVGQIKENETYDESLPSFRFDPVKDTGHNVYGGFNAEDLGNWLSLSATTGMKNIRYREWRTDAAAALRFSRAWSLEGKFRDKHHTDPRTNTPYRESDTTAQISCARRFSIYYLNQFRSDPGRNFTRNRLHSGGIRVHLWKGSYLDFSGGSIRGGLVCSGGQCRELPDFKGWKLATHLVF